MKCSKKREITRTDSGGSAWEKEATEEKLKRRKTDGVEESHEEKGEKEPTRGNVTKGR